MKQHFGVNSWVNSPAEAKLLSLLWACCCQWINQELTTEIRLKTPSKLCQAVLCANWKAKSRFLLGVCDGFVTTVLDAASPEAEEKASSFGTDTGYQWQDESTFSPCICQAGTYLLCHNLDAVSMYQHGKCEWF